MKFADRIAEAVQFQIQSLAYQAESDEGTEESRDMCKRTHDILVSRVGRMENQEGREFAVVNLFNLYQKVQVENATRSADMIGFIQNQQDFLVNLQQTWDTLVATRCLLVAIEDIYAHANRLLNAA